jgi:hypothetical protein
MRVQKRTHPRQRQDRGDVQYGGADIHRLTLGGADLAKILKQPVPNRPSAGLLTPRRNIIGIVRPAACVVTYSKRRHVSSIPPADAKFETARR